MREVKTKKNYHKIIYVVILVYLCIGVLFTIWRSNAHYNYFVVQQDKAIANGKSYWDNRCLEENKSKPGTDWCVNGFGQFRIEKPTRLGWYFFFYSKQPLRWPITFLLYPFHFMGLDMIHYQGVGGVWNYG